MKTPGPTGERYTCEDIAQAFMDLLDEAGHDWREIRRSTGLPESRCAEIEAMWHASSTNQVKCREHAKA